MSTVKVKNKLPALVLALACFWTFTIFLGAPAAQAASAKPSSTSKQAQHSLRSLGIDEQTPQKQLLLDALSQLGVRYRMGGRQPNKSFDCSGLTSWVFATSGFSLPRTASQQFGQGVFVGRESLQPGDLVFFKKKNRIYHVGIYLTQGKFIHSATGGKKVMISNLAHPHWDSRFAGGRRLWDEPPASSLAQARNRP